MYLPKSAVESLQWYREIKIGSETSKQQNAESQKFRKDLEHELMEMKVASSSVRNQAILQTCYKLIQPTNLRPFLIIMMLFFFYPLTGLFNISFFAVSLFTKLELGGAETVAVFTALLRCIGTLCSTFLLLR